MAWYDFGGNIVTSVFAYSDAPEVLNSAYDFFLLTDAHGQYEWLQPTFTAVKREYDFSKMLFIDLGDDCLNLSYDDVQNHSNYMLDKMTPCLSIIPADRQILLCGNHDLFWTDASGKTYLANPHDSDKRWIIDKYYQNSGCAHGYGNDVAKTEGNRKYVSISAWENDGTLGGYSAYGINSEHMDAIIAELSKKDGKDLVILSHVPIFTVYDEKRIPATDGNIDHAEEWKADSIAKASCTLDEMIKARNEHTSGTITDSYGNVHSYDFRNCDGKVLCCLAGHEHKDMYGYRYGILQYVFDSVHYDKHPYYFVRIEDESLVLRKNCDDGTKFDITLPLFAEKQDEPSDEPEVVETVNLFDESSAYNIHASLDTSSGSFPYSFSDTKRTFWFECKPNTRYRFACDTVGDRFGVFEYASVIDPTTLTTTNRVVASKKIYSQNSGTSLYEFTTSDSAKMVYIYYALNTIPTGVSITEVVS